ncbi:hypothetical protein FJZ19_00510 [Candidatus Pacearchaeota archaeon]|nr:hypothetical protein [Candidatus Pacearchaeota archaeon]
MAVKLSRRLAEMGRSTGLEEAFRKQGVGEDDVLGRIRVLTHNVGLVEEFWPMRLASGVIVNERDLPNLPSNNLNEVYKRLYRCYCEAL